MSRDTADFMIFLVEAIAQKFFAGDQARTYATMRSCGLWQFFVDTYDTSHTLSKEYLLDDAQHWLEREGADIAALSR